MTQNDVWFRSYLPGRAELPILLCLPHAGGSAGFFRALAHSLNGVVRLMAVQYPGRQDRFREPAVTSVEELAAHIASRLWSTCAGSINILGHSMGGLVGYELARILQRDDAVLVTRLVVTNMRAPSLSPRPPLIHLLDDAEFWDAIVRLGAMDSAVLADEGMMRLVLPALRADFRSVETYSVPPKSRIGCGITVAGSLNDQLFGLAEVDAWRRHTEGTFSLRIFDGDHFGLYRDGSSLTTLLTDAVAC